VASDVYEIRDLSKYPLYIVEGIADLSGPVWEEKLIDAVAVIEEREGCKPGLLILDALYNYHGADVDVGNLYERGRMLSQWQHMVHSHTGPKCVLSVVDHFRKSAKGLDLVEYQQSGMSQWAHTWWNAEHRKAADLDRRQFWLNVEIGSRDGYAGLYEIDIYEGPFDEDRMRWREPMRVSIRRVSEHTRQRGNGTQKLPDADIDAQIFALAAKGNRTTTDLRQQIHATETRVKQRIAELIGEGKLVLPKGPHTEGDRVVQRDLVKTPSDEHVLNTRRVRLS
jgi:hypothetical protein